MSPCVTGGRLLVIAGATAAGKSALGVEVAERLQGEIISADAVSVYRALDIGSDKPDAETRQGVPHHLIDVVEPSERFSAGSFVALAEQAIVEIRARNRVPVVVGGSHFYLRALLLGLFPTPSRDPRIRSRLDSAWSADRDQVRQQLTRIDPIAAEQIGAHDRQRILRALEVFELTGRPMSSHWQRHPRKPRYQALLVAPDRPRGELYDKIESRVDRMFAAGLVDEVRQLLTSGVAGKAHACKAHAFKAIGYRQVVAVLAGESDLTTAIARTKQASRKLANRQLAWLQRLREGRLCLVPPVERNGADAAIMHWDKFGKGSEEE